MLQTMRKRTVLSRSFLGVGTAIATALGIGLAAFGCETGTVADALVVTSVIVRADQLTRGVGCGERPGQVYKYAVVVKSAPSEGGPSKATLAVGLYDCFADAAFPRLEDPAQAGIEPSFRYEVFLYDKATYEIPEVRRAIDLAVFGDRVAELADVNLANETFPIGRTQCLAIQRENVQTVAACASPTPVARPNDASVADGSTNDASPDSGKSDSGSDAAPSDASADAASD